MGPEVKFEANLVVQRRELGLEYLLQVDVKGGRMFIDISNVVLSMHDGSFPNKPGEYFVLTNKLEEDE